MSASLPFSLSTSRLSSSYTPSPSPFIPTCFVCAPLILLNSSAFSTFKHETLWCTVFLRHDGHKSLFYSRKYSTVYLELCKVLVLHEMRHVFFLSGKDLKTTPVLHLMHAFVHVLWSFQCLLNSDKSSDITSPNSNASI